MPRTITIDGVQVIQVSLVKDQSGQIHVYCEYHLKAGDQVIQANHQEITPRLSAAHKTGALFPLRRHRPGRGRGGVGVTACSRSSSSPTPPAGSTR
ncbi:MAG: hypothetical protein HYY04_02005 [Chloroflexi bacterium]|nr:hypothetical protein [Chloroflexota bacterium]